MELEQYVLQVEIAPDSGIVPIMSKVRDGHFSFLAAVSFFRIR